MEAVAVALRAQLVVAEVALRREVETREWRAEGRGANEEFVAVALRVEHVAQLSGSLVAPNCGVRAEQEWVGELAVALRKNTRSRAVRREDAGQTPSWLSLPYANTLSSPPPPIR